MKRHKIFFSKTDEIGSNNEVCGMRVYIGSFQNAKQVCVWVTQLLNHKKIYEYHEQNIGVAGLKSPFNPALTKQYPRGSDSPCNRQLVVHTVPSFRPDPNLPSGLLAPK